ncbi:MAG TPA: hypothetical protein VJM50_00390 [Pyrinomonadaceae bacterium]|nr:hypothetical protein [Pyrinomonadaceae bacterium]
MGRRELFLLPLIVICLLHQSGSLQAQSTNADDRKFEVAGQFTLLTTPIVTQVDDVTCLTGSCPPTVVISRTRKTQPGFGGRIGYNLNSVVALEAELNLFPGADSFNQPEEFNDGYFLQGLFGVKAGKRFEKVGIFAKARPGFLYASKGDLEPRPVVCILIFPPPAGCFQPTGKNSFAFDVGGVVEIYPTSRTIIRFDFGDTIVRLSERNISTIFTRNGLSPRLVAWRLPAETTHNFQGSVGIGFRF